MQCSKCLKMGHWSYECKFTGQVYKTRVSKSQLLKNPKLRPSCVDKPPDMLKEEENLKRWNKHQKKKKKKLKMDSDSDRFVLLLSFIIFSTTANQHVKLSWLYSVGYSSRIVGK